MEEVLFGKRSTIEQLLTELETRDIFSSEMTKASGYHISSIQEATLEKTRGVAESQIPSIRIPEYELSSVRGVEAAKTTQIEISSALLYTVPIVGQRIDSPFSQKTIFSNPNISPNPSPSSSIPEGTNPDSFANIDPSPSPNPKRKPVTPPFSEPNINPKIDPVIDPIIEHSIDPIIDPTIINQKQIFTFGDSDFLKGFSADRNPLRKTKMKTIKNAYGDPFNMKIKL